MNHSDPSSELLFSQKDWIQNSEFHPYKDKEILDLVYKKTKESQSPVIIFDLDSTLFDTSCRTHQILREWFFESEAQHPLLTDWKKSLELSQTVPSVYSIKEMFLHYNLDLSHPEIPILWNHLFAFWKARFFSNSYLAHDFAYPGTAEFVNRLYAIGAKIVYLTGRDKPGMQTGTIEILARDQFPIEKENTSLWMKSKREDDDLEFKLSTVPSLVKMGESIAIFENEPRNLIALSEKIPGAMAVFHNTICSNRPAKRAKNLYLLQSFSLK